MSDESPVKKRLECSICLWSYNTTDHLPQALRCQHTFCSSCVDTLAKKPQLNCPKCRQVTCPKDVITNFALVEIVETLCQGCEAREQDTRCQHCNRNLCKVCDDAHIEVIKVDARRAMESLSGKLVQMTTITTDTNILKNESERSEQAKQKLTVDINNKRKALDEYEQRMFDIFDDIMDENIHLYTVWREDVDMKIAKSRTYIQNAERKALRRTINKTQLIHIQQDSLDHLKTLDEADDKRPSMKPFPEEIPQNVVDIPKGLLNQIKGAQHKVVTRFADGTTDFKSVKLKNLVGSKGSEHDKFNYAGSVTVIPEDDFLAVTDYYNGRVKVYDNNLKLLFMFGKNGSRLGEFNTMPGIMINTNNELYVADARNHRIQVFSRYGEFLRSFGQQGSAPGQFQRPAGMAFNNGGLLYICDMDNYRIQVFMPEGKFVRMFGSKGNSPEQFSSVPAYVLFTKKGYLLVVEAFKRVKVFHQDGRYMKTIPTGMPKSFGEVECNGITEDQYGNLILADCTGRLIVLTANGEFVCTIGTEGPLPGQFNYPDGVAVTGTGDIVVCDGRNHRLQLLTVSRRWDHVAL